MHHQKSKASAVLMSTMHCCFNKQHVCRYVTGGSDPAIRAHIISPCFCCTRNAHIQNLPNHKWSAPQMPLHWMNHFWSANTTGAHWNSTNSHATMRNASWCIDGGLFSRRMSQNESTWAKIDTRHRRHTHICAISRELRQHAQMCSPKLYHHSPLEALRMCVL